MIIVTWLAILDEQAAELVLISAWYNYLFKLRNLYPPLLIMCIVGKGNFLRGRQ